MLSTWLGGVSLDTFRAKYLRRAPLAQPGTVSPSLLDWPLLARVLAAKPDVLVVAKGELLPFPAPTELVALRAYFRMGIGLAMRRTEHCTDETRAIADAFASLGPSHVQMFVTPGGTHGFGWHYDDEDVFIAQTTGVKDYYLRANTRSDVPACAGAFAKYPDETSSMFSATLHAGDFLYIPARWWHMAVCRDDALSVSVGVVTAAPA